MGHTLVPHALEQREEVRAAYDSACSSGPAVTGERCTERAVVADDRCVCFDGPCPVDHENE